MWFAEEMNTVFENAIKPAIESEDCGHFTAHRVDKAEFNDDITDERRLFVRMCGRKIA
jgi:hypothetical protein